MVRARAGFRATGSWPGRQGCVTKSEQMKAVWIKSSLSLANGNCVEVAGLSGGSVGVRSSRDPEGPVLEFTQAEWEAFLAGVRLGEFDRFVNPAR